MFFLKIDYDSKIKIINFTKYFKITVAEICNLYVSTVDIKKKSQIPCKAFHTNLLMVTVFISSLSAVQKTVPKNTLRKKLITESNIKLMVLLIA